MRTSSSWQAPLPTRAAAAHICLAAQAWVSALTCMQAWPQGKSSYSNSSTTSSSRRVCTTYWARILLGNSSSSSRLKPVAARKHPWKPVPVAVCTPLSRLVPVAAHKHRLRLVPVAVRPSQLMRLVPMLVRMPPSSCCPQST
eukprot:88074-Pelagomonas_calceolata.AAC.7